MIRKYFRQIESSLSVASWVRSVQLLRYDILEVDEEEILIYRFKIRMPDNSLFEMRERVISKKDGLIETTTYSFHWQNTDNEIVKRWDNAPHHPEIKTYPHHVHVGKENHIFPSLPLTGLDVIALMNEETSELSEQ